MLLYNNGHIFTLFNMDNVFFFVLTGRSSTIATADMWFTYYAQSKEYISSQTLATDFFTCELIQP